MPSEWNELPEIHKKGTGADSWLNMYSWDLDPMIVGDLAALASYGMRDDHSSQMTDQELAAWVSDLDTLPVLLSVVSSPIFSL